MDSRSKSALPTVSELLRLMVAKPEIPYPLACFYPPDPPRGKFLRSPSFTNSTDYPLWRSHLKNDKL